MARGMKTSRRAEALQFLAGDGCQRLAQQDESRIGVLGPLSGRGLEWKLKAGVEQLLTPFASLEQARVSGQA